jgi:hypothetical protein
MHVTIRLLSVFHGHVASDSQPKPDPHFGPGL